MLLPHLLSLGLSDKEAKLYLTLLEIGANPVSSVSRKAGITRTTAYAALETLKEKGLVSVIEKGGIQQYAPVEAQKLEEYAKYQQEKAEANYQNIKKILPDLKSLTGDLVLAPKVKYFEGSEGIRTIYKDTIETLKDLPKAGRIKYSYSSAPEVDSELRAFLDDYIELRKKYGIRSKGIFPESKRSRAYQRKAKQNLLEARIMDEDIKMEFDSEVCIYGDKVAIMSLKQDRLHGVIIESPEIASTQRAIFELGWRWCREGGGL
jgi:sugar-specific transcriptional regulator TrmB